MLDSQTPLKMRSSTEQPLPFRRREDVVEKWVRFRDIGYRMVKDPCGLKYSQLQPEQYEVWSLLDGKRSLEDIRDSLQLIYPSVHVTVPDVQRLVMDLYDKRLLICDRPGQGFELLMQGRETRWKKFWRAVRNPLFMQLPGIDPGRSLVLLDRFVGWVFSRTGMAAVFIAAVASSLFLATRFSEVRLRLPEFEQFFAWPNLIYLWIVMGLIRILHEFGHGNRLRAFWRRVSQKSE